MAARPNPDEYNLPAQWVPVTGELARGRCLLALSETERLIFYNQDVLYHQNLEILQMLDELRCQSSHTSPNISEVRHNQTLAASEEAESVQKPVVEMAPPPVPSVRLPPVRNSEPSASPCAPAVPSDHCLTANPTAVIETRSTSAAQLSPFTLARANSLSGFAPMPSTLMNPQELPPVVKVPSSQENSQETSQEKSQETSQGKWQEKFKSLLSTKNEQGKREADNSDLEEANNHGKAYNPSRQELFKRQKLNEAAKAKDGNAVSGIGFGFSTVGADSNQESAEETSLGPSSAVGFLASASTLEADILGARSLFQSNESRLKSNESTASACQGTASVGFKASQEKDPGGLSQINFRQSISTMPEYSEFSFEELRLADYAHGRRFGLLTTPASFGLVKFGENTTLADFAQRNTPAFGSINRVTSDESPFEKALKDNPISQPVTSIFGVGLPRRPIGNNESLLGSRWSSNSAMNNAPLLQLKDDNTHLPFRAPESMTKIKAAAEGQSRWQAQKSEIMSQFDQSPKPATSIFPNPSASTTAALSPATASTSSSPQPRQISNATAPFTERLAHGNFLIARKCHPDDQDRGKDSFSALWTQLRIMQEKRGSIIRYGNYLSCFSDGKDIVLEFETSEEVAKADGIKIRNNNDHYYLCKAYQHSTKSAGNEPDTAEVQIRSEAQTLGSGSQSNESHKSTTNVFSQSSAAITPAAFQLASCPDKYHAGVLIPKEGHEYVVVRAGVRKYIGWKEISNNAVDCDVHAYLNKTTKIMTFLIVRRAESKLIYNTADIPGRIGNAGVTTNGLGVIRVFHLVGLVRTEYYITPTDFGQLDKLVNASNGTTW